MESCKLFAFVTVTLACLCSAALIFCFHLQGQLNRQDRDLQSVLQDVRALREEVDRLRREVKIQTDHQGGDEPDVQGQYESRSLLQVMLFFHYINARKMFLNVVV